MSEKPANLVYGLDDRPCLWDDGVFRFGQGCPRSPGALAASPFPPRSDGTRHHDDRDRGGRVELYADLRAAEEVGGDICHFFPIDEDHLALLIGDVADKGLAAALYAAVTQTLVVASAGPVFEHADRKERVLSEGKDDTPVQLVRRVAKAVDEFSSGLPQSDDQAMLVVRSA